MTSHRSRIAIVTITTIAALLSVACGERGSQAPPPTKATLSGGTAARVGKTIEIPAELVQRVVDARQIVAPEALDALVADSLVAKEALQRKLEMAPDVRRDQVAALAALVAERLRDAAKAAGAPSDAEVEELSALHRDQVDRPETVRTIHALAKRPKDPKAPSDAERAVASALARALRESTSEDDFEARAKAVPHDGVEVLVEKLPPFARDGKILGSGGSMDGTFSEAAHHLTPAGPVSDVVETQFGWHVIRLVERMPGHVTPLEERRTLFAEEAQAMRGKRAYDALLGSLRRERRVEVLPEAETLMSDAMRALSP